MADRARDRVEALANDAALGLARRLARLSYVVWIAGAAHLRQLPREQRGAAAALGFRPLATVFHGPFPVLLRSSSFVDAAGLVHLQLLHSRHLTLTTWFDDGTALTTTPLERSRNAHTKYVTASEDLAWDYRRHRALLEEYLRQSSVAPLDVVDAETVRLVHRLLPVRFANDSDVLSFVLVTAVHLVAVASIVCLIVASWI